jgi:chromosome segregation ATPase
MSTGNLRNSEAVQSSNEVDTRRKLVILQAEAASLREILQSSTEERSKLVESLQATEAERQLEKSQVSTAVNELTDAVYGAKLRNEELSNALADARDQLLLLSDENVASDRRSKELGQALEEADIRLNEALLDFQRRTRVEAEDRDKISERIASAAAQIDLLQTQLKDTQSKHWLALQKEKELSQSLLSRLDILQSEHENLLGRMELKEEDTIKIQEMLKSEVGVASTMSNSLRDELEKRLGELIEIRKDRDLLRSEKESFVLVAAERERTIKRNEVSFQKALEADRARLQQEVKGSVSRLRVLEVEKQELLRENEELSGKLIVSHRDLTRISDEVTSNQRSYSESSSQLVEMQSRVNDLLKELKDANRNEQLLRDEYAVSEKLFKDEMLRLEGVVKESKKAAASQVGQVTGHMKIASDKIDGLQRYNAELLEAERRAVSDAEDVRVDMAMRMSRFEELETKYADEVVLLRADLKDAKGKSLQMSESRSRLEVELMEVKVALTKAESETGRWRKMLEEGEAHSRTAQGEGEQMREKLGRVIKSYNELKLKFVENEEAYFKQNKVVDELSADLATAEREGMAEARGLRVTLSAVNIEVVDLKSKLDIQKKELYDLKENFLRLQSTTSNAANALLEELRTSEDAFTEYRRSSQHEVNEAHAKIAELNGLLERSRDGLEEATMKSKADRSVSVD